MSRPKILLGVNRELRLVPLDWQHPRDGAGQAIPLRNRSLMYSKNEISELLAEGRSREEIDAEFLPDVSGVPADHLGFCAYETTTEGTSVSPVFPNMPEGRFALAVYCSENVPVFADQPAALEDWVEILFGSGDVYLDMATGRIERVEQAAPDHVPTRR